MLSHYQQRPFKVEKLKQPRDFLPPQIDTSRPLVVEIGAGKGKHALQYASDHPDQQVIAIERTKGKFEAFSKLAVAAKLDNLLPVHADAIPWLIYALAPATIDKLYLLYPNPEPHNPNQQWLNMPFFEFLLSRLKTNAEIILASNIDSYINNAHTQAQDLWCLPTQCADVPKDSQRTHFEIKYLARGERCWQLTIHKPANYHTRFDDWLAARSDA